MYDKKEDYINFIAYDIEDEIYDIVKELKELNINKLTLTKTDGSNAINQFKQFGYETIKKGNIKTGSFIWILEKNFEDYEQEEAIILENKKAEIVRNFFNKKDKKYKLEILNNSLIDNIYNIDNKRIQMAFFYNNNYYLYDTPRHDLLKLLTLRCRAFILTTLDGFSTGLTSRFPLSYKDPAYSPRI